jgi:hypothetical protein
MRPVVRVAAERRDDRPGQLLGIELGEARHDRIGILDQSAVRQHPQRFRHLAGPRGNRGEQTRRTVPLGVGDGRRGQRRERPIEGSAADPIARDAAQQLRVGGPVGGRVHHVQALRGHAALRQRAERVAHRAGRAGLRAASSASLGGSSSGADSVAVSATGTPSGTAATGAGPRGLSDRPFK